ncbi:MAG: quinone-dependent dihydroorotate dehydrogenase [Alphaproteobacteria bacterium]|nr:quinone-dependent dihydroorotate dehydrogenase [Alphaproteobacteria bacterium]
MVDLYPLIRPFFMKMCPEKAHLLALFSLKLGLGPSYKSSEESLKVKLWGREFLNPLGIAAGFDKDAEVIASLFKMGFGFIEVGTVTPLPQPGNDSPRLFRDIANQSIVNRMGFPGKGLEVFAKNILNFKKKHPNTSGILGVNIGINKGQVSPVDDYRKCMETLAPLVDYVAINVSSPNTPGLRDMQNVEVLDGLLTEMMAVRKKLALKSPPQIFLKIAPDLDQKQRADIAEVSMKHCIDALIISNTTVTRPAELKNELKEESGGLSGRLIRELSTEVIRDFYRLTKGSIPIIGVGGISSAEDAYEKIRAGASLVQIYTVLPYKGPWIVSGILDGLAGLLKKDGYKHVSEAVGTEVNIEEKKVKAGVG